MVVAGSRSFTGYGQLLGIYYLTQERPEETVGYRR